VHRHALDVGALERYAVGCVPGLTLPLGVRQFKTGQSNPTFLLTDAAGHRYVLRKKPSGTLVATAHMIEREVQVLRALRVVDFPVPTVHCLCEDASVIGTPFYVRPPARLLRTHTQRECVYVRERERDAHTLIHAQRQPHTQTQPLRLALS
jgi:aminoglycoside phosphotransferase (APT) family kinase protein